MSGGTSSVLCMKSEVNLLRATAPNSMHLPKCHEHIGFSANPVAHVPIQKDMTDSVFTNRRGKEVLTEAKL
ncbi:autophagy protein Atg13 [Aspergillus luchuensis]|uniref:Autophagy protein Atg13 n=1 Tax=Aspergillus kawachii TaxID=1069201 RepID=A0A146F8E7_ASPKA|nr:autophagy protein Atg13 [Aspergillus luchuensis]